MTRKDKAWKFWDAYNLVSRQQGEACWRAGVSYACSAIESATTVEQIRDAVAHLRSIKTPDQEQEVA